MKTLIEEYGEAVVACVIGAILLPFIIFAVTNFYKNYYPTYRQDSMTEINKEIIENSGDPELIVNSSFRIKKGDTSYDTKTSYESGNRTTYEAALNKYKVLATAYEYGTGDQTNKAPEISKDRISVYGTENIDVNAKIGTIYIITYKVTNNHNHTITKKMKVLIG